MPNSIFKQIEAANERFDRAVGRHLRRGDRALFQALDGRGYWDGKAISQRIVEGKFETSQTALSELKMIRDYGTKAQYEGAIHAMNENIGERDRKASRREREVNAEKWAVYDRACEIYDKLNPSAPAYVRRLEIIEALESEYLTPPSDRTLRDLVGGKIKIPNKVLKQFPRLCRDKPKPA